MIQYPVEAPVISRAIQADPYLEISSLQQTMQRIVDFINSEMSGRADPRPRTFTALTVSQAINEDYEVVRDLISKFPGSGQGVTVSKGLPQ